MEIQETVEKKTTEYIIDISKVSVFFSSILFFYKSVLLFCNNVMGAKVYISIPEADDIALLRCLQISIVLHLADGKRRVWCCQTKNWHRYASKKRQRIWKKSLFFSVRIENNEVLCNILLQGLLRWLLRKNGYKGLLN